MGGHEDSIEPEQERRWMEPLSLAELGELTAQWLEGSSWGPWQCGEGPDEETAHLVPSLSAMNRSGYVTDFSQPGELDGRWSQRAAVTGFCTVAEADCLASLSLESELIVITAYPAVEAEYELPITHEAGRAHTRLAGRGFFEEPDDLWEECHPSTWSLLAACYFVTVCDPQWGRDDLLWPSVVAALKRDPRDCIGGLIRVSE